MKIFKTSFLELAAQLRMHCPGLACIDLWNEQATHWDAEPVPLPAVLLNFLVDEWTDVSSSGMQTGPGSVEVHVLQERYVSSMELAGGPGEGQSEALKRFDLLQAVHDALQNAPGSCFQRLSRSGQSFDPSHDALIEDVLTYGTVWLDMQSTPVARQKYNVNGTIDDVTVTPNTVPEPEQQESPFYIPQP